MSRSMRVTANDGHTRKRKTLLRTYYVDDTIILCIHGKVSNAEISGILCKAEQRGCEVIIADRFYASSKTCGYCGQKNDELRLSDRRWKCTHCGAEIKDRDFNAAINLRRYTERPG